LASHQLEAGLNPSVFRAEIGHSANAKWSKPGKSGKAARIRKMIIPGMTAGMTSELRA
jgi:hypothetical protein